MVETELLISFDKLMKKIAVFLFILAYNNFELFTWK
jgi:hypothetical protein